MEATVRQRVLRVVTLVAIGTALVMLAAGGARAAIASPAFWFLVVPATLWWTSENVVLKQDEPKDYRGKLNTRLLQASVTLGMVAGALDHYRFHLTPLPAWTMALGAALTLAGGAIRLVAIRTLDRHFRYELRVERDQKLVDTGLYARVRHPSYLGILLVAAGYALAFASAIGVALGAGACLATLLFRIREEERVLREAFGAPYEDYAKRTWRLVPFVY